MNTAAGICEQVAAACAANTPLAIRGSGSKAFYGHPVSADPLPVGGHSGIIDYTPAELVISARAGTPLREVQQLLGEHGQMLPFEPPHFGTAATLGGSIACGLSGPGRPWRGAARDYVLGVNCVNGKGELLRFGGQVMKNVAGYDVSRTMVGAQGTLGVLLDIHLKVLPAPHCEITLCRPCAAQEAIELCCDWSRRPLPLTAACHVDGQLFLRLSGSDQGVQAAAAQTGADRVDDDGFWEALREHRLPFFSGAGSLWRIALAPATAPLDLPGQWLTDWGGAQRWLLSDAPAQTVRAMVGQAGGHATVFRDSNRHAAVFHPLPPALLALHQRLRHSFDPHGILNPGRLYPEL